MNLNLLSVAIRFEQDVVLARQRARQVTELLGFDLHDQVRVATAVSEIARNVFLYAKSGRVEFFVSDGLQQKLYIRFIDEGPGIPHLQQVLDGQYTSKTGMGMGILGARRLMDEFQIESKPGQGTTVLLGQKFPASTQPITSEQLGRMAGQLARISPSNAFEELQKQNQELLSAMEELQKRQAELAQLNKELEDTNRGVVALYAELDEKADYLRRASEVKTQFLSNMTHEFRTPLNSILSLSRILLDHLDGELTPEQERQVKYIQKGATDLSELVNDLLDLAKVEAGKITIQAGEFNIEDLFGALRGMLRPLLAHNTSVDLIFEEPPELLLNTDERKVSQILRNLLSNALKYTEKGEVRVRAWKESENLAAFAVSDTGIGINAADQERIFEEYTQVEGPHQKGKKGTGLGLSLSRKLAQLLGGSLTVQSELGIGSTFILRVPVIYKGSAEAALISEIHWNLDPSRRPLLVVEDNRETLITYEKYLRNTEFQVIPAHSLQLAREVLARIRPVAIILDVLLGHENTWAFLSELKSQEETRDIPVFVVTMVANDRKALSLGANEFCIKPIDRQWLLEKLNQHVPSSSASGELLVVDDDETSRYVLKGLLAENQRNQVIEASSGTQGIQLARERRPTAIFLDLTMPGLSGFQFLEQLASDPATRQIPVIVHTSRSLSREEREWLKARSVAIIPKNHSNRQASHQLIREALTRVESKKTS